MAKFSDVNSIPATGTEAVYRLKEVLKAAGWVVTQSSDGTTYNGAGDQISHGGAGANGMSNTLAWFEIQEPETNGRSWSFQIVTVATEAWRIKMSAGAGFSGGSPGITQVGAATDEQVLCGTNTDAAPTGGSAFPANGTYRIHCIAQSTPVGPAGNRCYGWWFFSSTAGGGVLATLWGQEPMAEDTYPPLTGTRVAPTDGEADPCIYMREFSAQAFLWSSTPPSWGDNAATGQVPQGWWRYGYPEATWEVDWGSGAGAFSNSDSFIYPTRMGTGQFGLDVGRTFPVGRGYQWYTTSIGLKGHTNFLAQIGTNRAYPSTMNLATDAYVYAGHLLIPWEDTTAPLV